MIVEDLTDDEPRASVAETIEVYRSIIPVIRCEHLRAQIREAITILRREEARCVRA